MKYLGDFTPGQIVDFKFATVSTTGAPTTLAGSPAISVYKANSTTESTTGVTLTVDFDARTGMNHVRIDTSADTTFYAGANDFVVVVTTGTVGGTSVVGYVVAHFSLHNRSQNEAVYYGSVTGTATTTTLIDSGLTQTGTDHWKGRIVIFLTGSLKYQATDITAFDPALDKITFTTLTAAPSSGDIYVIV